MADPLQFRFDNTPFGGNQDKTLDPVEMPDWSPEGEQVKENLLRGDSGKVWKYTWYRKQQRHYSFSGVATSLVGTFGSLASEGVEFLVYFDVNDDSPQSGTGTYVFTGGAFGFTSLSPDVADFEFPIEELG